MRAEGKITVVPEVLVAGGGGAVEGLAATLMRTLGTNGQGNSQRNGAPAVTTPPSVEAAAEPDAAPEPDAPEEPST